MEYLDRIRNDYLKLVSENKKYSESDKEKITKAYLLAEKMHECQFRKNNDPYIIHPVEVSKILLSLNADSDTICAGLLHDTIEDTSITKDEIAYQFNDTIAELVDGVTKMRRINFESKREQNLANTRKIITGIITDVRIIIIKLADRLHNMRTLEFMRPEKQTEIALETMEIFVPLANYVGTYWIKNELEDLSLYYLKNDVYQQISEVRHRQEVGFNYLLDEMKYNINKELLYYDIENELYSKIKNIYGIYKRQNEGYELEDMHDLLSLKIIVKNIPNCYRTLGLVHKIYLPLDYKFKDYICKEKSNMYRSLHTTVYGESDKLVQTRIRTKEMDEIALNGLTANWNLDSEIARKEMKERFMHFKSYTTLKEIDEMFRTNDEFISQVRSEIFSDKIYVYTPKGEMIELPLGSTPVDFAYQIHSYLGDNITDVKVNDKRVKFDYQLKTGDRVFIYTEGLPQDFYNEESLMTARAKRKIKEKKKDK